jgi:hypothetical protein
VTNRGRWDLGQRLYARSGVVGCFMPEAAVPSGKDLIRASLPYIDRLRSLP